jgi:hypothetical protein
VRYKNKPVASEAAFTIFKKLHRDGIGNALGLVGRWDAVDLKQLFQKFLFRYLKMVGYVRQNI